MMEKIAILLILILSINLALAVEQNLTIKEKASACLEESESIIAELAQAKFNIQRVNDSLSKAENLYQAQLVLELQKNNLDFSSILLYCQEIFDIRIQAYKVRDELYSTLLFYNGTSSKANMSDANALLVQINQEVADERYEQALVLIEELNKQIIETQAQATRLNIFYEATSKGLKQFLIKNWISIVIILAVLVVLYFIYKKRIAKYIIRRKIANLELKKETLKSLIKRTQYEYFQEGTIAEGIYNIRTSKFAELIRDVDRQLPLLREELEKVKSHQSISEEKFHNIPVSDEEELVKDNEKSERLPRKTKKVKKIRKISIKKKKI